MIMSCELEAASVNKAGVHAMVLAGGFGTGQVLWSLFWLYILVVLAYLIIRLFGDILRSDDISGLTKAMWAALIIFLPYIGVFFYVVVRGDGMTERANSSGTVQDSDE
jgi:hypothetical protein